MSDFIVLHLGDTSFTFGSLHKDQGDRNHIFPTVTRLFVSLFVFGFVLVRNEVLLEADEDDDDEDAVEDQPNYERPPVNIILTRTLFLLTLNMTERLTRTV